MEKLRKGLLLLVAIIGGCISQVHAKSAPTPSATRTIINSTIELGRLNENNVNRASELQQAIQSCFAANLNLKGNEFYLIGLDQRSNLTSQSYSNKLKRYIFTERKVDMDCDVLETVPVNGIELGKDEVVLYVTKLKKDIACNGRNYQFWQEIDYDIDGGGITSIKTTDKAPRKDEYIDIPDEGPKSAKEYLNQAAKMYTSKKYAEAYNLYSELTRQYSQEPEGWYRLALMIYKQKGCKGQFKKPREVARDYMQRAYNLASGKLKTKAENVLYYWDHPNYM